MTGPERHYQGEKGREYHQKKRSIPERAIPWVARLRAEKIQPHVQSSDTVFEFGAGFGWNLRALQCVRKVAYDIADVPRESSGGVEWIHDLAGLPEKFADVIICHHALEHVMNPPGVLESMRLLLRDSGRLLLHVPFEKERRYRHFDPSEPNHHLYSWNAQTLGNLVSECGFKPASVEVSRFGYDRFAASLAVKLGLGEPGFRIIRGAAHLLRSAAEVRLVAGKS